MTRILDDSGRLYGLINVVDLLAVLVVLAVVAGGAALLLSPSDAQNDTAAATETEMRYATLSIVDVPVEAADEIQVGDSVSHEGHNLTVTDVYVAKNGTDRDVAVRAALEGETDGQQFTYGGAPPRIARTLQLRTETYNVEGEIRDVETDGESLALQERDVVVETTMSTETFDSIQVGDTYEVGGQTLATIESLEAYNTGSPGVVRVKAGITYTALERRAGSYVGPTLVREGQSLSFEGPVYNFAGTIERTGALEPRGEPATRTVTLELQNVDEAVATTVTAGAAETVGGEQVATVTDVEEEPATLVLTTQEGEVFVRDHPTKRNLQLTVEMQVRETTAGPTFKGEPLRQGDTVTLDLGTMTIRPTVVRM